MPSLEGNFVNDPLGVVRLVFERCKAEGGDFAAELQKQFKARVLHEAGLAVVPSLNDVPLHDLKGNCLVRYRGMVQDMFGPEIFLSQYELRPTDGDQQGSEVCCGWYQDLADCPPGRTMVADSPHQALAERQSFYCVPLPGETDWAKQAFASKSVKKETLDSSCSSLDCSRESQEESPTRKRGRPDEDAACTTGEVAMGDEATGEAALHRDHTPAGEEAGLTKRVRTDAAQQGSESTAAAAAVPGVQSVASLNFPLPGERGPACIVKVYDDIDAYRVNEMLEFIGVLSVDPSLASDAFTQSATEVGMDADTAKEDAAHSPPPNIVPRLHCIGLRRLVHSNPLLPADADQLKTASTEVLANASACRDELSQQFAAIFGGDQLAAEFLLLALVSNVYARLDASILGKFSLNISGVVRDQSEALVKQLSTALSLIVPKFYKMPMSLGYLNKSTLRPKKDYSSNRLTSGQLQLSDSTTVLFDETALSEGQLSEVGVANIVAINSVLSQQKLSYDFQYQAIDFPTNVNGIVISEGKSILQVDCQVPLQTQNAVAAPNTLSDSQLNILRTYLTAVQRIEYDLPPEVQKHLQDDFVAMRKDHPDTVTAETFHHLLLLARLLCISRGQALLDITTWTSAKQLEAARAARLPALSASTR